MHPAVSNGNGLNDSSQCESVNQSASKRAESDMQYRFAPVMLIGERMKRVRTCPPRIVLLAVSMALLHACAPDPASLPARNKFAGLTNQQIVAQLGNPTAQFAGPYGNPPVPWADRHKQLVTCVYVKPSGTLYLSIEPAGARWICICSNWLPKGGAF